MADVDLNRAVSSRPVSGNPLSVLDALKPSDSSPAPEGAFEETLRSARATGSANRSSASPYDASGRDNGTAARSAGERTRGDRTQNDDRSATAQVADGKPRGERSERSEGKSSRTESGSSVRSRQARSSKSATTDRADDESRSAGDSSQKDPSVDPNTAANAAAAANPAANSSTTQTQTDPNANSADPAAPCGGPSGSGCDSNGDQSASGQIPESVQIVQANLAATVADANAAAAKSGDASPSAQTDATAANAAAEVRSANTAPAIDTALHQTSSLTGTASTAATAPDRTDAITEATTVPSVPSSAVEDTASGSAPQTGDKSQTASQANSFQQTLQQFSTLTETAATAIANVKAGQTSSTTDTASLNTGETTVTPAVADATSQPSDASLAAAPFVPAPAVLPTVATSLELQATRFQPAKGLFAPQESTTISGSAASQEGDFGSNSGDANGSAFGSGLPAAPVIPLNGTGESWVTPTAIATNLLDVSRLNSAAENSTVAVARASTGLDASTTTGASTASISAESSFSALISGLPKGAPLADESTAGGVTATRTPVADPRSADVSHFLKQVGKGIEQSLQDGRQLTLRLNPPELGALRIDVRMSADGVTARIEAQLPQTHSLLSDTLPQLRDSLQQQGMTISSLETSLSDLRQDNGGQTAAFGSPERGDQRTAQQQWSEGQGGGSSWQGPETGRDLQSPGEGTSPVRSRTAPRTASRNIDIRV